MKKIAFLSAIHLFSPQYLCVDKSCFKNNQPRLRCNKPMRKWFVQASSSSKEEENDRVPCSFDLTTPLNINANWSVWNRKETLLLYQEYFYSCTELQLGSRLELLASNVAKLIFTEVFPCSSHSSVFILCGRGWNGAIGMLLALELKKLGYQSRIVLSDGTRYSLIYSQVQNQVPILDFIPSTMEYYADFVVDAIFGVGQQDLFPRVPFDRAISVLSQSKVPVVSLDVPSGWYVDGGPPTEYMERDIHLKPEVLISLEFPKVCTLYFYGAFQFLVKGIIPLSRLQSMRSPCVLPPYPSTCYVLLDAMHQTTPQLSQWGKAPGEIYGQGKPMPTLFSEPRISRWVYPEEEDDLWDELD
ncbi:hypothetical protein GpartN1_g6303.t1 [Galdieria partita]|uniref:NAD(P)H-hydrate epimerase n=1 Tax=Galdieria partita TaxID=83374 RepID=A0A9C7UTB2_9RHOD|nr:hypothetical protein GpartN1_g6303.t1 [Galdieria partita]